MVSWAVSPQKRVSTRLRQLQALLRSDACLTVICLAQQFSVYVCPRKLAYHRVDSEQEKRQAAETEAAEALKRAKAVPQARGPKGNHPKYFHPPKLRNIYQAQQGAVRQRFHATITALIVSPSWVCSLRDVFENVQFTRHKANTILYGED